MIGICFGAVLLISIILVFIGRCHIAEARRNRIAQKFKLERLFGRRRQKFRCFAVHAHVSENKRHRAFGNAKHLDGVHGIAVKIDKQLIGKTIQTAPHFALVGKHLDIYRCRTGIVCKADLGTVTAERKLDTAVAPRKKQSGFACFTASENAIAVRFGKAAFLIV